MDAKLKTKWVKALRSGKYKQGEGILYESRKHCCLGVLCRVLGMPLKNGAFIWKGIQIHYLLEDTLNAEIGLDNGQELKLSNMNDGNGVKKRNFREIADYIEANL